MHCGSGRDHNGNCFTVWFAGAGVKPGYSHGESDEFGVRAAIDKTTHHNYHATVLHLLGIDDGANEHAMSITTTDTQTANRGI